MEVKDHPEEPCVFELIEKASQNSLVLKAHRDQIKEFWLKEIREFASDVGKNNTRTARVYCYVQTSIRFAGDTEESSDDLQEFSTPTELSEVPVPQNPTEEKKPEPTKEPVPVKQVAKPSDTSKTAEPAKQVTVQQAPIANGGLTVENKSVAKSQECVVSVVKQSSAVEKVREVEKTESDIQVENFSVGVEVNVAVDDMSRKYSSGLGSSARAGW